MTMKYKQEYSSIEIDSYPDDEDMYVLSQYLESLQLMAKSLNKSSEISIEGGASFSWKIKITAEGEWA